MWGFLIFAKYVNMKRKFLFLWKKKHFYCVFMATNGVMNLFFGCEKIIVRGVMFSYS